MVSFDVTSLFTNVPLYETIDIILQKIYIDKKSGTIIPKREIEDLLHLCTRNLYFSFNGEIYVETDGVAMVLANISMVELKNTIMTRLENKIKMWKRYVDDKAGFAKVDSRNLILTTLNSFHSNIKFTIDTIILKSVANFQLEL